MTLPETNQQGDPAPIEPDFNANARLSEETLRSLGIVRVRAFGMFGWKFAHEQTTIGSSGSSRTGETEDQAFDRYRPSAQSVFTHIFNAGQMKGRSTEQRRIACNLGLSSLL